MKNDRYPLGRLIDIVPDLVNPRIGIIHNVDEVRRDPGAPDFFHFSARACNTAAFSKQENFSNTGGASARREIAAAKAIGEAIERYSSALFVAQELPLTSYSDAPFPCIPPEEFPMYSEGQLSQQGFPWVPFRRDTLVRWTKAWDLHTGAACYVPAAMVYMPYIYYASTGDSAITQPISTGLACHCSPAEAALSGLCEVIERDAFTIMWQARLAMPQIRVETLSDSNYDLVRRFERAGGSVTLLNITTDVGVPTVLSILRTASTEGPALVFAAATSVDPEEATRKALDELAHTRRYSNQLKSYGSPITPSENYENVTNQSDHLHFYSDHRNAHLADFIFSSRKRIDFGELPRLGGSDPEHDLRTLVKKVHATGHRALVTDLTSADVRPLGLTVVRALLPGFHPLFMGHRLRSLGCPRRWQVPNLLGYPGHSAGMLDNPAPHPYP